ncbi:hypothetical protein H4582DRAFT_1982751 [Lactarius indigo]|nr:hypothetical protein H4582DRAFT_1982751 [Lactarius indigo]
MSPLLSGFLSLFILSFESPSLSLRFSYVKYVIFEPVWCGIMSRNTIRHAVYLAPPSSPTTVDRMGTIHRERGGNSGSHFHILRSHWLVRGPSYFRWRPYIRYTWSPLTYYSMCFH